MFYRAGGNKTLRRVGRKNRFINLVRSLATDLDNEQVELASRAGLKREWILIYQTARYSILILSFLYVLGMKALSYTVSLKLFIIVIVLFLVSTPRKEIMSSRTPFTVLMDYLIKENKKLMNQELTRVFSMFKNLAVIYEDNPPSGLFLLEKLKDSTKKTRPIFTRTINLLYENKVNEASFYFQEAVGTDEGREFASIIKKLDELQPHEFREQIDDFYKGVMEGRKTKRLEEHERRSFVLYSFVAISAILVLGNFVVVAYMIDGLENILQLGGF